MPLFESSKIYFLVLKIVVLLTFFVNKSNNNYEIALSHASISHVSSDTTKPIFDSIIEIEKVFSGYGLIDIHSLDSSIIVDLKYSTSDNFMNKVLYHNLKKAYFQKEVAEKLAKAQKYLKEIFPHYSLVVLDASRPASIQKMMWNEVPISSELRAKFLASPNVGSLHSYGAAVDVTICDGTGQYLDMGTPFDSYDELAYPSLERSFAKEGKLQSTQLANRLLLRNVMKKAGFSGIETEWWHFNACSRIKAMKMYALIESHIYAENKLLKDKVKPNIQIETADNKPKITFKIQIKTSVKSISLHHADFKGLKVEKYKHEGLFKYTVGEFTDLESAREYKKEMWNLGFNDAFIAAFNHNKRIGIMDAIELLNVEE